jgi:putative ABC transport system permease protein
MKKTFFKNLYRDIKKSLSRFLSIVIIIAVGVAFYAGVRATSPDMKMSGDIYFKDNNLMDFKLISTLGLTEDDIKEIKKLSGVTQVEGSYSLDAVIEKDKHSLVMNVNSLPGKDEINKLSLVSGRLAEKSNEVVAETRFLKENNYKVGDTIILQSGKDSKIEDSLKNNEFVIVGEAESPLYISAQRQLSSVGNGSVRGFLYILPEVFKSEVYTEIYVRTNSEESENSLLDNKAYKETIKKIEEDLKQVGVIRGESRYAEVLNTANEKIKEGEDKLNSSRKEADEKFAEGYQALADATDKLAKGEEELEKNEILFNKKMQEGTKQIADGKKAIQAGETEINSKAKELEQGKVQLAEGRKKLEAGEAELNSGKGQAAVSISSAIGGELAKAKAQLATDPNNQTLIAQYGFLNQLYENINGKDFDSIYNYLKTNGALSLVSGSFDIEALKGKFDSSALEISNGKKELAANEKVLQAGEEQLNAGRAEIVANKKKISDAEIELEKGRQEGRTKLDSGRLDIENGKKEVQENTEKIKAEEQNAKVKLADGEAELLKSKDKVKDIKKPEWYVLGRAANVGFETYRQDSDRIDNIGKAFPLIFFLVAALVSLTTMTRMVQENRIEIGTFKALGYSRGAIVSHYLIYSLTASLLGSLIGISFGFKLFPPLIMNAYSSLYSIPKSIAFFNRSMAIQASLIAILFTTVAAVAATLEELREVPASLLRPKPPKSGKKIFLESITFIWKRLSFTRKVTARNIFRYKQRFFMTVIGIGACTGLMVTGYGLKEGIIGATETQFNDIYKYHMITTLTKNIASTEKDELKQEILKESNVSSVLFYYSKNGSVKKDEDSSEDAYVVVPEEKDSFNEYIRLSSKGKELKLQDDGVILTQKFAKLINKKVGDTFEITLNDKQVKAKIVAITEHYIQHYIYMSPEYYKSITGEDAVVNSFYGMLKDRSEAVEEVTSENLKAIENINSISFKNKVQLDFGQTMDSINSVVFILIVSAGVLAFVVIYNLTNINITERRRELATIKLLGFYNKELASYIYRENTILTIIGSFAGIFIGIFINNFVVSTAETNIMMFMRKIGPIYFVYSVIFTIFFSVIVNLTMYSRFDKIDMIESLKNAE